MPALLRVEQLSHTAPDGRRLFDRLDLDLGPERLALVGDNGSGKSTLLRLLAGELPVQQGRVTRLAPIALLRQQPAAAPTHTLADLAGVGEAWRRWRRGHDGTAGDDDLDAVDWGLPARLAAALARVGLADIDPDRPASTLSGGQCTRAALAGLWLSEARLLLLDEPSNHLDREGRRALRQFVEAWPGGLILASHDRALLEAMPRVLALQAPTAVLHGGGFASYVAAAQAREQAARRTLDNAERALAQARRDAQQARERQARRDAAGRRFAATGSAPKLQLHAMAERAEHSAGQDRRWARQRETEAQARRAEARAAVTVRVPLAFEAASGAGDGPEAFHAQALEFAFADGVPRWPPLTLSLGPAERLWLDGPNGSGKSTLLRLLAGACRPSGGTLRVQRPVAWMDQGTGRLDDADTLLQAWSRLVPDARPHDAHAGLAASGFRSTQALRRVGSLSGGERVRLALAGAIAGAARDGGLRPLLLLDEPTNHLDLAGIEALEAALRAYPGPMVVVSHDPVFIDAIGVDRRLRLPQGQLD